MNLMESLEKVANEVYPEEGRINRGLLAESFLGSGPIGYLAKKNNSLGVSEDDSHAVANAKLTGGQAAVGGALGGATVGALLGGAKGGIAGAGLGGLAYGTLGAGGGALSGALHDKYDELLRRSNAGSVGHEEAGLAQTASSGLMESLEKTASEKLLQPIEKEAANFLAGIKNTLVKATGKDYRKTKNVLDKNNTVDALKTNVEKGIPVSTHRQSLEVLDKQVGAEKKLMQDAQKKIAVGAAPIVAGAVAGGVVGNQVKEEEKTASEDFMNELYKEAATAILDMHIPEVKEYSDPMNRIQF